MSRSLYRTALNLAFRGGSLAEERAGWFPTRPSAGEEDLGAAGEDDLGYEWHPYSTPDSP